MRKMTNILCPIDLSDTTREGARHAAMLARWYHARVTVLHVCNPITIPAADFAMLGPIPIPALTEDERKDLLEQIARECTSAGFDDVDLVIQSGNAAARIVELSRSLPADLVVIGTHGASGFQHLVLGSVAEKVLRQASCPVLTVPPRAHTKAALPFSRVLCPVDFSDPSDAAVEFAFSIASESNAQLTVLHVFEWPPDGEALIYRPMNVPEALRQMEHDAGVRLKELVARPIENCRPAIRIAHGKAYREILGVATEEAADLIVMGVHGRNALDRMLFGSTTNQVIRRATCPVLTVRQ